MSEAAAARLADTQAVIDACSRYAAAVDRSCREPSDEAFAEYAATMTEDCVVDYGPLGRFEGRDAWLAFARGLATRSGQSQHLYANFLVEIDGDTARARFHALAIHHFAGEPVDGQILLGAALFDNRLRRTSAGWKLCFVQPNVQFLWDPGGAAARMFPPPVTPPSLPTS